MDMDMDMDMEEELNTFIRVWILAAAGLSYSYYVASKVPKGFLRLLSLVPVFYIFIIPPLSLNSYLLTALTNFFLVWLANFKLLLFAFDQPPLSPLPPNLFQFIFVACFPIKFKETPSKKASLTPQKSPQKPLLLVFKFISFLVVSYSYYKYQHLLHPKLLLVLYCIHTYMGSDVLFAITASTAEALFGIQIEPQFDEPYLSTSLQEFWGRRWNLMVTGLLRSTVYIPVQHCVSFLIGRTLASFSALIATFFVSGLMHEVGYFYLSRVLPTGEVTWFFVLNGICVAAEVAVKKAVKGRWRLHPAISTPLTVGFVTATAIWLYFPQMTKYKLDDKALRDRTIFADFVKLKLRTFLQDINHII